LAGRAHHSDAQQLEVSSSVGGHDHEFTVEDQGPISQPWASGAVGDITG
jgi:hypothetical protein